MCDSGLCSNGPKHPEGRLSPGALHFNGEIRPQVTDLRVLWENRLTSFEKKHTNTFTEPGRDFQNMMRPKCHVTRDPERWSHPSKKHFEAPWACIGHLGICGQHSARAAGLIHFLCCCSYVIENYLYYLKASLPGSWKSILMHSVLRVCEKLISYTWAATSFSRPLLIQVRDLHRNVSTYMYRYKKNNLNVTQTWVRSS